MWTSGNIEFKEIHTDFYISNSKYTSGDKPTCVPYPRGYIML